MRLPVLPAIVRALGVGEQVLPALAKRFLARGAGGVGERRFARTHSEGGERGGLL